MPDAGPGHLIRLFVSSTFADFAIERDVLQREVFPQLRQLCAAQGFRFEPIDLRWGVSKEAGNEKRTLRICFEEILRCQRLSPDLNFLILLGDRYGSCFLPASIPSAQVARLLPHLDPAERILFDPAHPAVVYREDHNAVSPEYVLLPAASSGRDEETLRLALCRAARAAGFSAEEVLPFEASATHLEIQRGLLDAEANPESVVCAFRTFVPASSESGADPSVADAWVERDPRRHSQVMALKRSIEDRLPGRVRRYAVPWDANGPRIDRERLARKLLNLLKPRVRAAIAQGQRAALAREPGFAANSRFIDEHSGEIEGRDSELAHVAAYLAGDSPQPLLITGASGIGKSSLLARARVDAARTHPRAVIVARYLGMGPASTSLANLLGGLRREVALRYGKGIPEPITVLPELVSAVARDLEMLEVPAERPLFLILDAVDQLDALAQQQVDWLPHKLAAHVRVVISGLPGSEALTRLRAKFPNAQALILSPLTRDQGKTVLRRWLATDGRALQPMQEQAILDSFAHEGNPLFLHLAYLEAHTWRSFTRADPLPTTIPGLLDRFFAQLELPAWHGRELVAHALGDLAVARHGLAEDELLDVLARDEAVRASLHRLNPDAPEIDLALPLPVVLWARLYADLDRYFAEVEADGTPLVTFYYGYHQQFREVIAARYLRAGDVSARHHDLAAYFDTQPFRQGGGEWNRRKLAELAYHQAAELAYRHAEAGTESQQTLRQTLTDARFLEGKLAVEDANSVLEDLACLVDNRDVHHIAWVVRGWASFLEAHPEEVANQVEGRRTGERVLHNARWEEGQRSLRLLHPTLRGDPALVRLLEGHREGLLDCAMSADGRLAISASHDETVCIWDITSGAMLRRLEGHRDKVWSCALSADGRRALTGSLDETLRLWDVGSGQTVQEFVGHGRDVRECALSADGRVVLSASWSGPVRVWDAMNGKLQRDLEGASGWVSGCALSANGQFALVASAPAVNSSDRAVRLRVWDVARGRMVRELMSEEDTVVSRINDCALSADGRIAFSAHNDGTVQIWEVDTGRRLHLLTGHNEHLIKWVRNPVECCAISADGRVGLSGTGNGELRVWDVARGQALRVMRQHGGGVSACALSADGRQALSGVGGAWIEDRPGVLHVWDLGGVSSRSLEGHLTSVEACALTADGYIALSASPDKTLRVWDVETGRTLRVLEGHTTEVLTCALSADGRVAISALGGLLEESDDHTLHVWNVESGTMRLFAGHASVVRTCALSADGRFALSGSDDHTLRVWDVVNGQTVKILKGHDHALLSCAMSADGRRAISGAYDGELRVWDIPTERMLHVLEGHSTSSEVWGCALSADGRIALSTASDSTLRVWNTESGKMLRELGDYTSPGSACALSADGRIALSRPWDNTLQAWDTATGQEIVHWTANDSLRVCALSADGRIAIAGDVWGAIHFLDLGGTDLVPRPKPTGLPSAIPLLEALRRQAHEPRSAEPQTPEGAAPARPDREGASQPLHRTGQRRRSTPWWKFW